MPLCLLMIKKQEIKNKRSNKRKEEEIEKEWQEIKMMLRMFLLERN